MWSFLTLASILQIQATQYFWTDGQTAGRTSANINAPTLRGIIKGRSTRYMYNVWFTSTLNKIFEQNWKTPITRGETIWKIKQSRVMVLFYCNSSEWYLHLFSVKLNYFSFASEYEWKMNGQGDQHVHPISIRSIIYMSKTKVFVLF
jgi:hypothetical protein